MVWHIGAQPLHLLLVSAFPTTTQLNAHTVTTELELAVDGREKSGGDDIPFCISSAASSSISVVAVPLEVTGDGPTISLGEVIWAPLGDKLSSIEYGRK